MARISITFKIDSNSLYLDEILGLIESAQRTAELEAEAKARVSQSHPAHQGNQDGNH